MKFTTPVSMQCTQEQFKELEKELYNLGYKLSRNTYTGRAANLVVSNFGGENGYYGRAASDTAEAHGRYYIDHYNPELFLALAAMSDHPMGLEDEYYIDIEYGLHIQKKYIVATLPKHTPMRKATKEELIAHFTKKQRYALNSKTPIEACLHLLEPKDEGIRQALRSQINMGSFVFDRGSIYGQKLQQAGVWDLWVEPYVEKEKEFVLPEKWAVKRTNENYREINVWCNANKLLDEPGANYQGDWGFIHSWSVGMVDQRRVIDYCHADFTLITFEQFKQYVLKQANMKKEFKVGDKARYTGETTDLFTRDRDYQIVSKDSRANRLKLINNKGFVQVVWDSYFEPVEEKKQIGWKLKSPEYITAIYIICRGGDILDTSAQGSLLKLLERSIKCDEARRLEKADVLTKWFEPIYEEEKKEIKLILGSSNVPFTIMKDGIFFQDGSSTRRLEVNQVMDLKNKLTNATRYDIAGYPVFLSTTDRFIKVGCSLFSMNELNELIEVYKQLNP